MSRDLAIPYFFGQIYSLHMTDDTVINEDLSTYSWFIIKYLYHEFLHAKTWVETCVNTTWETLEMGSTESRVLLEIKTWDWYL